MFNIKSVVIKSVIILALILTALVIATPKAEMLGIVDENFYTETCFICEVDEASDEFYIQRFRDETVWAVKGIEDWFVGDIISVTFADSGTKNICDDEIREIKYVGYISDEDLYYE